jgi:hypothetical protein
VQLNQVERRNLEVPEAALDVLGQIVAVVALFDVRTRAAPDLGGYPERITALAAQASQESFAVAVAIDVRRVEEVDAEIQRAMQAAHCFGIIHLTPGAADGPGTETDAGDLEAGSTECFVLHGWHPTTLRRRRG